MAGLQDLLEAYRNKLGTQEWRLGQQMNRVPGAEEAMDLWGGFDTGGLAGAIKTYHMTPFDFEKFDLSKMHSGIGGTMHGRGVYTTNQYKNAENWASELPEELLDNVKILDVNLRWPDPAKEALTPLKPEDYLDYNAKFGSLPEEIQASIFDLLKNSRSGRYGKAYERAYKEDFSLENLKRLNVGPLIQSGKIESQLPERGIPGVKVQWTPEWDPEDIDYITYDPAFAEIIKKPTKPKSSNKGLGELYLW